MRMLAKDAVVTVDRADGFRILESFGYVSGLAARPQNMLRETFRSIGAFIGLAPIEYLTDAERTREDALENLRSKASALGANAVLDLQFHVSEEPDGSTKVLAFGRAVRLDREMSSEVRSAS